MSKSKKNAKNGTSSADNSMNSCQNNMKYSDNNKSGGMTDCDKKNTTDKNETNCR